MLTPTNVSNVKVYWFVYKLHFEALNDINFKDTLNYIKLAFVPKKNLYPG